jgi:putative membrane protein
MPVPAALLSALHLLALAIGLPAVVIRASALQRAPSDPLALRQALSADGAWGIAALLWLLTGPVRAFGPFEKGAAFYLASPLFYVKMGLFLVIFAIEVAPMVSLIRWRMSVGRGETPDLSAARLYAQLSWVEAFLVVVIVFVAAFMARGIGIRG